MGTLFASCRQTYQKINPIHYLQSWIEVVFIIALDIEAFIDIKMILEHLPLPRKRRQIEEQVCPADLNELTSLSKYNPPVVNSVAPPTPG